MENIILNIIATLSAILLFISLFLGLGYVNDMLKQYQYEQKLAAHKKATLAKKLRKGNTE